MSCLWPRMYCTYENGCQQLTVPSAMLGGINHEFRFDIAQTLLNTTTALTPLHNAAHTVPPILLKEVSVHRRAVLLLLDYLLQKLLPKIIIQRTTTTALALMHNIEHIVSPLLLLKDVIVHRAVLLLLDHLLQQLLPKVIIQRITARELLECSCSRRHEMKCVPREEKRMRGISLQVAQGQPLSSPVGCMYWQTKIAAVSSRLPMRSTRREHRCPNERTPFSRPYCPLLHSAAPLDCTRLYCTLP